MKLDLHDIFNKEKIDYEAVYVSCGSYRFIECPADISIIIPCSGRLEFTQVAICHILQAAQNVRQKISLTFVEHSVEQERQLICEDNKINYIHIPRKENERFNKCLCHNIGALYSNPSKFLMFHDIDTLMQEDFFIRLLENINRSGEVIRKSDHIALQCFTEKRLLNCEKDLTAEIIAGKVSVNDLTKLSREVYGSASGALGGSILVDRELFFKAGGFAPEFFSEYSVEDAHFWGSLLLFTQVHSCDNPPIEMFHLYHPPAFNRTTKAQDWDIHYAFLDLEVEDKMELVKLRSEHLKQFIK